MAEIMILGTAGSSEGELLPVSRASLVETARAGRLFALLDACEAPALRESLNAIPEERLCCLYRDEEEALVAIAPYLLQIETENPESELTWLEEEVDTESGALLLISPVPLEKLRQHFRRLLLATDESGESYYFRFYDPRVLRSILSTSNIVEKEYLYGPVKRYLFFEPKTQTWIGNEFERSSISVVSLSGLKNFILRKEHLARFETAFLLGYTGKIMSYLHQHHSNVISGIPESSLELLVEQGIRFARQFGLKSEYGLSVFVALLFEISPSFWKHPYIRMQLTDPEHTPERNLAMVLAATPERVWQEASKQADFCVWFPEAFVQNEENETRAAS